MTTPKSVQLQGALPLDPLTRGSAPGPRWGHSPQTPIIGSRSALAIWPPPISTPGSAPVDGARLQIATSPVTFKQNLKRVSSDNDEHHLAFL